MYRYLWEIKEIINNKRKLLLEEESNEKERKKEFWDRLILDLLELKKKT
jgi:hypothetical protein